MAIFASPRAHAAEREFRRGAARAVREAIDASSLTKAEIADLADIPLAALESAAQATQLEIAQAWQVLGILDEAGYDAALGEFFDTFIAIAPEGYVPIADR